MLDPPLQEKVMFTRLRTALLLFFLGFAFAGPALADDYADTIRAFQKARESSGFFSKSYGYAVFPTIGKAGVGIGGAHGKGRVYAKGAWVGDAAMTQVTVGAQLGGEAFSQIIFFEDERAFKEFTSGNFEFGAQAQAVVITAGAAAQATTGGTGAGKNIGKDKADVKSTFEKGMAVFTLVKGGLMYEASVGGQKFSYTPKARTKG
jgi:lipid-binding SYLF domain-containing protein